MFCARLDMSVDGHKNTVKEVDVLPMPKHPDTNPYGNAFNAVYTPLVTELQAQRDAAPGAARSWTVQNSGSLNPVNGRPVGYKLLPQTRGPSHPALLTGEHAREESCGGGDGRPLASHIYKSRDGGRRIFAGPGKDGRGWRCAILRCLPQSFDQRTYVPS